MNYLEEQTDGEAMINSIQNGDQPFPVIAQVSLAGTAQNAPPTLKDPKFWTAEEKKTRKIDRLARSLLIQRFPNDIYSLIDSNKTAKDLHDALERQMHGFEYGEQDRKAAILYEYETFKAIEGEQLLDTYLRYLQVINDLKKCGYKKDNYVNDALGYKKKAVVVHSDLDWLLRKQIKFYSKPTKNNLRTSSTSQSANKKQEFVKTYDKKVKKKVDEKKRDMSKVKCYNCKKEGHFAKYCKKAKVKDYNYYKTKMLLAKKDSGEQVLLAEDQAWMESKKIIIDLEDEVVNLLEKEKANLETIESLKSKGFESSENAISEIENQSENDCHVVEKECDKVKNPKMIAPRMFKLNLDTFSSVRRPKHSGVIWKKKRSSNTSNVDLFFDSCLKLNKNVKRYSRKDLLACNNSHLGETSSAYVCNDAMNVSCNSRMCDLLDDNNFFIFDDDSVRISPVRKMFFRKKPRDSINVRSKTNMIKPLPRTIVQICLWIIDSGCSKHMTSNRALLTNFVETFLGTVCFGNNDFAVIAGYGDVVIGSMTIKKVYYVEGLGHNLFSVGQFCDEGLEVFFRKSTCFVRNEDGVDLLTGDRLSNLYTIALNEVASNFSTCLLAKASSSQS
nr:integrase, catalytic region, zinc finger, CCHC-type, peptidase aspartic, catalytic [Tanacetum cinerariifolium]